MKKSMSPAGKSKGGSLRSAKSTGFTGSFGKNKKAFGKDMSPAGSICKK